MWSLVTVCDDKMIQGLQMTEAGPMMIINTTRIMGYTAMAFAAAALGTQELAAYQAGMHHKDGRRDCLMIK